MSFIRKVESWAGKLTPKLIRQKNGFYEMSYLVNSPKAMIEQFKKLPFVHYDHATQSISAQTPFLNNTTWYREVDEGLHLLLSESTYKKNVCFRCNHDPSAAAEHYCLSFRNDTNPIHVNSLANGVSYENNSWLIFKPGARVNHYHFKGAQGIYLSAYFTLSWLKSYLQTLPQESAVEWITFLNSERDHMICPHLEGTSPFNSESIRRLSSQEVTTDENHQKALLRETLAFFSFFTGKLESEHLHEKYFLVGNMERLKVLKVEKILQDYLFLKFPGIEYLARETGFSETKLKESFKAVHETTLFQYFQQLQMQKAKEMILQENQLISEIARKFSYVNASKFATAFRKHHECLPSEVCQKTKPENELIR